MLGNMGTLGIVGCLAGALLIGAGPASAETKILFNTYLPLANPIMQAGAVPWAKAVEEATKGRVKVDGAVPPLPPLKAAGDPTVQDKICVAKAIPDDSVVVGANNGLANVFVFAKKLPAGVKAPPPPTDPIVLDQQGCRFVPQAMVFRAGQPLLMKNSDSVSHNVRTTALSMAINQIVPPNDTKGIAVTYKKPERMPVQTKCDIHAWMLAWHLPLDHPGPQLLTPGDGAVEVAGRVGAEHAHDVLDQLGGGERAPLQATDRDVHREQAGQGEADRGHRGGLRDHAQPVDVEREPHHRPGHGADEPAPVLRGDQRDDDEVEEEARTAHDAP